MRLFGLGPCLDLSIFSKSSGPERVGIGNHCNRKNELLVPRTEGSFCRPALMARPQVMKAPPPTQPRCPRAPHVGPCNV